VGDENAPAGLAQVLKMALVAVDYDKRTGRPLTDGEDRIDTLSDEQLEAELTIAAAEPTRRAHRLEDVLVELSRRHQNSTGT
jgi:hypothetical protein